MTKTLIALACLMGAAGVALSAAAAHSDSSLSAAASMLLLHAPAVIVAVIAASLGLVRRPVGITGAAVLVLGAALFAGDITLRVYAGRPLFAMAAPAGGMLLIAGWLVLAASALLSRPPQAGPR